MKQNNWVNEAMFYHIFPLGFVDAPRVNEGEKTAGSRILKVLDFIPYLKALGINAIYFGPVFESQMHGYDTSDYYQADSRLGTNEDLRELCRELKGAGIRVVLDGVFNHVGRGFGPFQDVLEKREQSEYRDWFCNLHFGQANPFGDGFTYETWQGNHELVKLNLKNPAVIDHLLKAVEWWIDTFDIDGLRLDAADCVDMEFFKKLRQFTKGKKPDFWLMGEIIHGDYNRWANEDVLDSVTNYECWKGLYSSHNDKNYFEIAYALNRQFGNHGIYKNLLLYNFADNHDVSRVASILKQPEHLKNLYTMLFTMPGVPSIYYGSEWGIEGKKGNGADADLPLRPGVTFEDTVQGDVELTEYIKELIAMRKTQKALHYGNYEEVMVKNEQFIFARRYEDTAMIALFNLSDADAEMNFTYRKEKFEMVLEPFSSVVLKYND